MNVVWVALGAAVGAPLRFLVDKHLVGRLLLGTRIETPLPWGTFTVNVLGSFVLGMLVGVGNHTIALLAGTGFCGAFTTYSTFAAETTALATSGHRGKALLNVVLNLGAGLLAAVLGAWLTK
ncbi:fluoride efflux transporter CrcB [Kribbella sp. NPDC051952]|uniref:fluoride efflux transporter CrcB n=1 Tax=Kribbella sp. NPDC051952 TaxID=3154851 RepID=UPI003433491D